MLNSQQIRALRKFLKKTQTEFAVLVGVSYAAVRTWEDGIRHPVWKHGQRLNALAASLPPEEQDHIKALANPETVPA